MFGKTKKPSKGSLSKIAEENASQTKMDITPDSTVVESTTKTLSDIAKDHEASINTPRSV